jgi:hypothetical protein
MLILAAVLIIPAIFTLVRLHQTSRPVTSKNHYGF